MLGFIRVQRRCALFSRVKIILVANFSSHVIWNCLGIWQLRNQLIFSSGHHIYLSVNANKTDKDCEVLNVLQFSRQASTIALVLLLHSFLLDGFHLIGMKLYYIVLKATILASFIVAVKEMNSNSKWFYRSSAVLSLTLTQSLHLGLILDVGNHHKSFLFM